MNIFPGFPDDSRVWVYLADRFFTDEERVAIESNAKLFVEQWTAHNHSLKADATILYNCIIAFVVDENIHLASGCSIDKLHAFIRQTEKAYHINLLDRLRVAFRAGGIINNVKLNQFIETFKNDDSKSDLTVFNMLVESRKQLNTDFEISISDSWLAQRLA